MTNKKTTKPKTKTTLSQKQKTAIGIGLLGIILIAILVGVVFVFQNKTDEFSVNTGVDASTLTGDAQTLTVGEDGVEITSGGIYELKTNIESGCVIVRADNADVELILNNVSITNSDGPAIYVESADNFYLQLVGSNTLVATTSSDFNGAIYSKDDILIYGDGSLDITSNIDGIVGKDDFDLGAGLTDQIGIELHIIHAGKTVLLIAEQLPILGQIQHIAVRINAIGVQRIPIDQVVADLVRGIGEHEHDLLGAFGDAAQTDRKPVATEDGEDNAHGFSAELGANIGGNVVNGGIVALRPCDNSLCHADDIPVANREAFALGGLQDTVDNGFLQIIAFANDRGADASGYRSYHATHISSTSFYVFNGNTILQDVEFVKQNFHPSYKNDG